MRYALGVAGYGIFYTVYPSGAGVYVLAIRPEAYS